jgi:hypothetical protein
MEESLSNFQLDNSLNNNLRLIMEMDHNLFFHLSDKEQVHNNMQARSSLMAWEEQLVLLEVWDSSLVCKWE